MQRLPIFLFIIFTTSCFSQTDAYPFRTCQDFTKLITALDKDPIRDQFIEKRISNLADTHKLFRAFPAFFYYILDEKLEAYYPNLFKFSGMTAGDPHIENFGIFTYKKDFFITVDDFDDVSTKGHLFKDFLRLLTSISIDDDKLLSKRFSTLFSTYLKSLESDLQYSQVAWKKISSSFGKETQVSDDIKIINNRGKFKEIKRPLCADSRDTTLKYITSFRGKSKFLGHSDRLDTFLCRHKMSGSTGGLKRHYYITKPNQHKFESIQIKLLSLKPAIHYNHEVKSEDFKKDIITYTERIFGKDLSYDYFETFLYKNRTILLKRDSNSFKKFSPEKFEDKHKLTILQDQMNALAKIHKTGLEKVKLQEYILKLSMLDFKALHKNIKYLNKLFSRVFGDCSR